IDCVRHTRCVALEFTFAIKWRADCLPETRSHRILYFLPSFVEQATRDGQFFEALVKRGLLCSFVSDLAREPHCLRGGPIPYESGIDPFLPLVAVSILTLSSQAHSPPEQTTDTKRPLRVPSEFVA